MGSANTISIDLPPELLVKAQEFAAREHRTMNEVFRDALQRYIRADPEWRAVLERTRQKGEALGIATEADVERSSDEYRQTKKA